MSTASGFTPGTATLKGRLARPGSYTVGGLTSGVTYHFKLRGADAAGNYTAASTQVSSTTGSASSGDIITIEGDQIIGGTITGQYISGGTITGGYLSGGTISGGFITGGTVNGGFITGGTIEGSRFQTSGGSSRVSVRDNIVLPFTTGDGIEFFGGSTSKAQLAYNNSLNQLFVYCDSVGITNYNNTGAGFVEIIGDLEVSDALTVDGPLDANGNSTFGASGGNAAFRVQDDDVYSYGIDDNTTANAANVRVGASAQLLKSTSTVRLKDELAPLDDNLAGVPPEKLTAEPPSVDPYDVLSITPTEFRSLSPADADARSLGFIAEDVAAKFPWAANWDDDGLPSAVEDRPIIAALVAVIKDLRSRIEALEA
jgi:hypothetical protein